MKRALKISLFLLLVGLSAVMLGSRSSSAKGLEAESVYSMPSPYTQFTSKNVNVPCGTKLRDRDGFVYPTVQIGAQCWMAENLKTITRPDGVRLTTGSDLSERDCIAANNARGTERDCQARGALYTLAGIFFDNDETQDICPTGWRTPKDADFAYLEQSLSRQQRSCEPNRSTKEGSTVTGCRAILPLDDCKGAGDALKEGGRTRFNWQLSGFRSFDIASNTTTFAGSKAEGYLWSRDHHFNWCGWNHANHEFGIYRRVSKFSNGVLRDKIEVGEPLVGDTGITAMPVRCIKK